jgi:hypothetical protein
MEPFARTIDAAKKYVVSSTIGFASPSGPHCRLVMPLDQESPGSGPGGATRSAGAALQPSRCAYLLGCESPTA